MDVEAFYGNGGKHCLSILGVRERNAMQKEAYDMMTGFRAGVKDWIENW